MKTKIMMLIVVFLISFPVALMLAQPGELPPIRMAQEQNTECFLAWPSEYDFEIDPNETVLPEGFNVYKEGNAMLFHCIAGDPNVLTGHITVTSMQVPGGIFGWTGKLVEVKETRDIEWNIYRRSMSDFFNGLQDILLIPSAPVP